MTSPDFFLGSDLSDDMEVDDPGEVDPGPGGDNIDTELSQPRRIQIRLRRDQGEWKPVLPGDPAEDDDEEIHLVLHDGETEDMQEDMETEEPVSNKEVLGKTQMDSIAEHGGLLFRIS